MKPPPDSVDEAAIDLGSASDPPQPTPPLESRSSIPPTGGLLRQFLAVIAGAAITLAATLLVTSGALSPEAEPPRNIEELTAAVFEDLTAEAGDREVELFALRFYDSVNMVLEPGRYQVLIKCGQLSRFDEQHRELRVEIAVEGYRHESLLACPSTVLRLEHRFEFADLSPFVAYANIPFEAGGYIVGVAVFAVTDS
ncbi:hypothetical protein FB566_1029 [Stackebrandtia endophytica]|uniref:Uncharacterized protein n=1 Tax=Stackebrandtia endophytica TaxID=1496996 RepID=A0A543ASH0_9ACTN|nr:hypothetical protein [Stackebrandtia endophytica]TQL75523.1 hypothetical protein FB566_1029 [Stackebrandtia endophytica]